jgi:itaconate CoA-transferase
MRHPQLAARDGWQPVETPGGTVHALLPPVDVTGQTPVLGAVPALGQHNEKIRAEVAE